jgi:hypothetical protein
MFTEITLIDFKTPIRKRLESRKVCGPYRWTPSAAGKGRGFYMASNGFEMDRHGSTLRLRIEPANDHISGRMAGITGYYCDEHGDQTLEPIIARLPHGRGFLAGWTMGAGMCASLGGGVYEDVEDAARGAHSLAEYDAEESRWADAEERENADEDEDDD